MSRVTVRTDRGTLRVPPETAWRMKRDGTGEPEPASEAEQDALARVEDRHRERVPRPPAGYEIDDKTPGWYKVRLGGVKVGKSHRTLDDAVRAAWAHAEDEDATRELTEEEVAELEAEAADAEEEEETDAGS